MTDDVKLYVPVKYRKPKQGYSTEEKVFVLNEFKRLGSGYERDVMEQIIEDIEKGARDDRGKMDEGTQAAIKNGYDNRGDHGSDRENI